MLPPGVQPVQSLLRGLAGLGAWMSELGFKKLNASTSPTSRLTGQSWGDWEAYQRSPALLVILPSQPC